MTKLRDGIIPWSAVTHSDKYTCPRHDGKCGARLVSCVTGWKRHGAGPFTNYATFTFACGHVALREVRKGGR